MTEEQSNKPLKGILYDWAILPGTDRVRGRTVLDLPDAGAWRGDVVTTSAMESIYAEGTNRILVTKNSRYFLVENNPFLPPLEKIT